METESKRPLRVGAATVWRAGLTAAAIAALTNLVVYLAARAADVSFLVPDWAEKGELMRVSAVAVFVTSVAPLVVGSAAAAHIGTRFGGRLRLVQVVGGVLALGSLVLPLSLDADGGTRLSLAIMHVVAGAAFVLALWRVAGNARGSDREV